MVKPERKTAIEKKVVKKTPADKTKKAISVIKKKKTTSAPKKAVNKKKSAAIKKKPTTAPKVNKTTVATA